LDTDPVQRITIDLDPTNDPTHGAQQLIFFNGHYDTGAICRGVAPQLQRRAGAIPLHAVLKTQ